MNAKKRVEQLEQGNIVSQFVIGNVTAQEFVVDAEINPAAQIFSIQSGCVVVADEAVRSVAALAGVDVSGIVRELISKDDLEIIFAHKPRAYTGQKWTDLSKERINDELTTWPSMPKDVFSLDDIAPILAERRRLRKLEPCYTYEHLLDYAHYKKGLSWAKSESYAKYACCSCCYG